MDNKLIEFTDEERKVIRSQFFPPSASNEDMVYCMSVAKELGLNPILKEIYFVERNAKVNNQWVTKIEPLAGKNAWIKLAHNSGQFSGLKTELTVKPVPIMINGVWELKDDLVAICHVMRKDFNVPFTVEVAYNEYVGRKSDGSITKFWKEKPQTMLRKVATVQALKEAFSIAGIMDQSEIDDIDVSIDYKLPDNVEIKEKPKPKRARRTKAEIEAQKAIDEAEAQEAEQVASVEAVVEEVIEPHPKGLLIDEEEEKPKPVMIRSFYPKFFQLGLKAPQLPQFIQFYMLTPENVAAFCEHEAILKEKIEEFNSIPL